MFMIADFISLSIEQTRSIAIFLVDNYLAKRIQGSLVVYLIGELGAGKTTFIRELLLYCGVNCVVKSPTYTIVETYEQLTTPVYHFDLYRLEDPQELEILGVRDYLQQTAICFFEWPEKGKGYTPRADYIVEILIINDNSRKISIYNNK